MSMYGIDQVFNLVWPYMQIFIFGGEIRFISTMVFEIQPFIFTYPNSWMKIGQSSKMLQFEHQNVPSSLVAR